MTFTVKHAFQSAKSDGIDLTLVQPSNWNEAHVITLGSGKFIGRVAVGDGPAEELNITDFAAPVAAMLPWAGPGNTPPTGWLLCNGQAVSRTTYAALFAAISTTYGVGDGSTTFNVPDLRGRSVWGRDTMGTSAANVLNFVGSNTAGTKFGVETHNHTVNVTGSGNGVTVAATTGIVTGGITAICQPAGGGNITVDNTHTHDIPPLTVNVTSVTASGTTSAALASGMNPGMISNWIIKT